MGQRGNPNLGDYKKDYWNDRVLPKLELVEGWARNGLSNVQIATNLGIGESTFTRYLGQHEELKEVLRGAREDAEIIVENAMFKRAVGYSYKEVVKERVKEYDDDGEWTGKYKMTVVKSVTKHVAGDVGAQQYWLEHRAPKRWEKNPTAGIDTGAAGVLIQSLADLVRNPVKPREIGSEQDG